MVKVYSEMSDFELVCAYKNAATTQSEKMNVAHVLYQRYYPLVCKMKIALNNSFRNYKLNYDLDDEDYNIDAWEELIKSLDSVKVNKIEAQKSPQDYKHYIRFLGYLKSLNRNIRSSVFKDRKNKVSIDLKTSTADEKQVLIIDLCPEKAEASSEEAFLRDSKAKIIRTSLNNIKPKLNRNQEVILSALESDVTKKRVCDDLGITMYNYNKELAEIQNLLKKEMSRLEDLYV